MLLYGIKENTIIIILKTITHHQVSSPKKNSSHFENLHSVLAVPPLFFRLLIILYILNKFHNFKY